MQSLTDMKTYENAKYLKDAYSSETRLVGINVTIDEIVCSVPLDPANTHYAEMMKLVDAGELTIAPADEEE